MEVTTESFSTELAVMNKVREVSMKDVAVAVILFIIVIITIGGNIIVLLAICFEKKLRNNFSLYVANLALTDLMVGLIAMLFYTFDTVMGYWPFGQFMCGLWIFFDYAMTFASVFTLVAISFDRFVAVRFAMSYKSFKTKKNTLMIIGIIWSAVVIIWLPPFIQDRISRSEAGVCWWDPSQNTEFVYVIAVVGHHLPCLVIIYCYICVVAITRKKFGAVTSHARSVPMTTASTAGPIPMSTTLSSVTQAHTSGHETLDVRQVVKKKESSAQREKNIFVTLSYILATYLICWLPFHIIFDLSFLKPHLVSDEAYTFGFWAAYFNSTLNPIIYAYSNAEYRRAFKKVITCKFMRK